MRRKVMEAIYPCVAGLDVHQAVIVACRRRLLDDSQVESEVAKFGGSLLVTVKALNILCC